MEKKGYDDWKKYLEFIVSDRDEEELDFNKNKRIYAENGDFVLYIALHIPVGETGHCLFYFTEDTLRESNINLFDLFADARKADRERGACLLHIGGFDSVMRAPVLCKNGTDLNDIRLRNLMDTDICIEDFDLPVFILTKKNFMYGASLIFDAEVRGRIWKSLGRNYYVMPSSIHEVLIVPDNGSFSALGLNDVLRDGNEYVRRETPDDFFSNKLMRCTNHGKTLEIIGVQSNGRLL